LAYLVITLIGMAVERSGRHRAYQANTETRRVLSFLVLATAVLRRAERLCSLQDFRVSLASIPSLVIV